MGGQRPASNRQPKLSLPVLAWCNTVDSGRPSSKPRLHASGRLTRPHPPCSNQSTKKTNEAHGSQVKPPHRHGPSRSAVPCAVSVFPVGEPHASHLDDALNSIHARWDGVSRAWGCGIRLWSVARPLARAGRPARCNYSQPFSSVSGLSGRNQSPFCVRRPVILQVRKTLSLGSLVLIHPGIAPLLLPIRRRWDPSHSLNLPYLDQAAPGNSGKNHFDGANVTKFKTVVPPPRFAVPLLRGVGYVRCPLGTHTIATRRRLLYRAQHFSAPPNALVTLSSGPVYRRSATASPRPWSPASL